MDRLRAVAGNRLPGGPCSHLAILQYLLHTYADPSHQTDYGAEGFGMRFGGSAHISKQCRGSFISAIEAKNSEYQQSQPRLDGISTPYLHQTNRVRRPERTITGSFGAWSEAMSSTAALFERTVKANHDWSYSQPQQALHGQYGRRAISALWAALHLA